MEMNKAFYMLFMKKNFLCILIGMIFYFFHQ